MKRVSITFRALIGLGLLALNPFFTAPVHGGSGSDCVPSPAGLVAWWPAEGNASDVVGGNPGVLIGGISFASGEVGQAFNFNNTNAYVFVPGSATLDVGSGNGFTLEAWINPTDVTTTLPLFEWGNGTGWGVHFHISPGQPTTGSSGPAGPGQLYANIVDDDTFWHQLGSSAGVVAANVFQHVALTYDKTSGVATLYCNGQIVSQTTLGTFTPLTAPSYNLNLGRRQASDAIVSFAGRMDEPAIYNRALSSTEIAAIYNAGSAGKCPPVPAAVSGTNGTVVKIYGTNFSTTVSSNIVYFGAVQAAVLSASPTNLAVTVPVGATYAPVTVTVNGLTAYSSASFLPVFNRGGRSSSFSLASRLDFSASDGPGTVLIADLDGDGKPDLVVNNGNSHVVSLYQNISSNGTMTASSFAPRVDLALGTGAENAMAVADLNGDGKLDIVLLDRDVNQVVILQNIATPGSLGTNSFAAPVRLSVGTDPRGLAVWDLDGDGKLDIAVANWGDSTVSILRNLGLPGSIGTNSFASAAVFETGPQPQSLAIADLDGDGLPDIVTVNNNYGTNQSVSLLRNTSSVGAVSLAAHVDLAGLATSYGLAIGDLDGDGKPDLAVSSFDYGQSVSVYRNTSTPGTLTTNSFASPADFSVGGWGNAVAIGDLDGDGKPDLAVVTQLPDHLSLFRNVSSAGCLTTNSFAPRVDYPTGWNPNGIAIGDLDGDGRPDITFGVSYATTLSVYQNQTPFSGPPVITLPPTNEAAVEGASVVLSVAAAGAAPLAYQWSFNGAALSGATQATLTLTNLHLSQAGNYQVRVANAYGAVTSSVAIVTVVLQNLLVYTYSGTEEVTTANLQFSYKYSGQMFFIPAGTNGTFVGWGDINGKKQYWVSPFADYRVLTIPGSARRTYTVLGKVGEETDDSGKPHIWAFLHRGQNAPLAISRTLKFSFPNIFSCNETHVYPDTQTGNLVLREAVSTYTFSPAATQTANNNGQTMTDLVNELIRSLVKQGYQKQ
jgi:hypothetical protein